MLLAGIRQHHPYTVAGSALIEQWSRFLAMESLPSRVGGSMYGVMCGHDAAGFEYMCAGEVESFAELPEGLGRMRVPEQRYAVFPHRGPPSSLRSTWERILDWLGNGPYESAHTPDFEVYSTGANPTFGGGDIEIWAGVVERSHS